MNKSYSSSVSSSPIRKKKIQQYLGLFIILLIIYFFLKDSTWTGGTVELHTIMEAFATSLTMSIGVISIVRFYSKKNNTFLFIGAGFLGTSFLEGYHMVVTSTFFYEHFPSELSSLSPWSWVAARLFLSILMLLSWWAWKREEKMGDKGIIKENTIYIVIGILTLVSFLFFVFVPLPRAYYPEYFFHRPQEIIPGIFFLLALIGYFKKGHWEKNDFEHWMILFLIISFSSQLIFMTLSGKNFDMMFDVAHLLKKLSYIFVLNGLLISMFYLFKDGEEKTERIKKINSNLNDEINERIKAEKELQELSSKLEKNVEDLIIEQKKSLKRLNETTNAKLLAEKSRNKLKLVAEQLANSNKELTQFAFIASHDLQEPLRKVEIFGSMLETRLKGNSDEKIDNYISVMVNSAKRMRDLINGLLSYSKITSSTIPFQSVNLDKIVAGVVSDLQTTLENSNGKVEWQNMLTIEADHLQLRQLFQNLISNSIKYSLKGEKPLIKIHCEEFLNPSNENFCKIFVKDNGIGFDEKYSEKIFEVFQRLHPKTEYKGSGIGLSICKRIMERHNGTISVISKPDKGSTFILTLPIKQNL
ncbi:MAG: hypothetical protein DWQ06_12830 [Calditrichaeota bacterium]|nr:MAG: hypothetical protein DWQ06_12830 [Calditrichota bacterium]